MKIGLINFSTCPDAGARFLKPLVRIKAITCTGKIDDRIPEKEIEFLKDLRSSRKMILSESKDMVFNKHRQQILAKTRNNAETD